MSSTRGSPGTSSIFASEGLGARFALAFGLAFFSAAKTAPQKAMSNAEETRRRNSGNFMRKILGEFGAGWKLDFGSSTPRGRSQERRRKIGAKNHFKVAKRTSSRVRLIQRIASSCV